MWTIAFAVRQDEIEAFSIFTQELNMDVELVKEGLSMNNVHLTRGYKAIIFFGMCDLSQSVLTELYSNGVRYISSRSTGYNNVDIDYAKKIGIKVSNANYSPHSVEEYTVMFILMAVREMKKIMRRVEVNDYSLPGIQGKEMYNLTFGVIGTGSIGQVTAKILSSFGGKVLAYNSTEKEEIKDLVDYVSLDYLLMTSDVITLHLPLTKDTKIY